MVFANSHRPRLARFAAIVGLAIALSACASSDSEDVSASATGDTSGALGAPITLVNDGTTALEGHTPRGFAGSGVGLFAGDNLNSNFPQGEGIQILLTFALPEDLGGVPTTATLRSDVMSTRGDVFDALGELRAAPVVFEAFSAELWNIEPVGDLVTCERSGDASLTCDVSEAAAAAVQDGRTSLQLQLTLEEVADNDGEQDLVLFNNGDSNVNEPGLFTLELS